jgi:hypothetical protein
MPVKQPAMFFLLGCPLEYKAYFTHALSLYGAVSQFRTAACPSRFHMFFCPLAGAWLLNSFFI